MGKILLLSFEDEMINSVLSALQVGKTIYIIEDRKLLSEVQFKNMLISFDTREVIQHNRKVRLTFTEFEILQLLAQNPGKVYSKEQIYDIVWKEPYSVDYNIVMSHIRNIREKIGDNPNKPFYVQTVWGVGYRFNPQMVEKINLIEERFTLRVKVEYSKLKAVKFHVEFYSFLAYNIYK